MGDLEPRLSIAMPMASIGRGPGGRDPTDMVKPLLNKTLVNILKEERLPHSGVKSAMQKRLADHIENLTRNGEENRLKRLQDWISNPDSISSPARSRSGHSNRNSPSTSQATMPKVAGRPYATSPAVPPQSHSNLSGRLNFKESPFFAMLEPLTHVAHCPASAGRNTVVLYLQLPVSVVDRLRHDPQLRVMLYCAADSGLGPFTKVDVAFPHQVELKVNGDEVKANLRGLKNRPGSTRPVDITGYLRKSGTYQNIIALSYAMTQKKFMYVVNLVKVHPVDELVNKLQNGRVISKSRVINDMVNKSRDLEIEETSEVMSLKCPLSTLRIDLPCRSTLCSHKQCFDATSFLQLQEQAPTWTCPLCSRIFTFEALVVDQYVNDILKSTDKSVDQVTIHPDGQWSQGVKSAPSPKPVSHGLSTSEDDDIVEIRSMPFSSPNGRNTPVANVTLSASSKSTNVGSREASYSSTPHRYPSSKRPIGKVIDLTTSDDDDEEPPRAAKRKAPVGTSIERETPNLQSIDAASGQDHRVNFRLPSVEASRPGALDFRFTQYRDL